MKHLVLIILLILLKCVMLESSCFAWEKSLPGSKVLLEAKGTTLVGVAQERILYSYTIRSGDTLWDIAKWALNDPFLWPEMLKYNFIKNPDLIYPGIKIIIPSQEILERLRTIHDVDEIQKIRQDHEQGAQFNVINRPNTSIPKQHSLFNSFIDQSHMVPLAEIRANSESATALEIKGRKSITIRYRDSQRDNKAQYYSEGYNRQESLDLTVNGKINDSIKVKGQFYQSDQQLEERYNLLFTHEMGELFLGDFNATLPEADHLLSNRHITGGRLKLDLKKWGLSLLSGAARGQPYYERFFGNRTQGPYYLIHSQVVEGSEQVMINKQVMIKGTDYRIDYLSGNLTFLNQVIDDVTQVEVLYESKGSGNNRTLAAGRFWVNPNDWLKIATSSAYEFQEPQVDSQSNTPVVNEQLLLGATINIVPSKWGELNLDWAGSRTAFNNDEIMYGQLVKSSGQSTLGPVRMKAHFNRSTPLYQMIGGLDQGQDSLEYGGQVDIMASPNINLIGDWDIKNRLINQSRDIIEQASSKAQVKLKHWPELRYLYYQLKEQNLSPTLLKDHQTKRHTGTINYDQEFWAATVQGEYEMRSGELGSRPGADTQTINLALNSKNSTWLNLSSAYQLAYVDQQGQSLSASEQYQTQSLSVKGSILPSERFQLNVNNQWVWDEVNGSTTTLDSNLVIKPIDQVQLNGAYSWETLTQLVGSNEEAISVQTASGQLNITPWQAVQISLMPNWRWSEISSTHELVNQTQQDLAQFKWAMTQALSHELELRKDHTVLMNVSQEPISLQTDQHSGKGSYRLNTSFSNHLSGKITLSYEEFKKNQFNFTQDDVDQSHGRKKSLLTQLHASSADTWRLEGEVEIKVDEQYGSEPDPVTRTAYPLSSLGQSINDFDQLNNYGSLITRSDHVNLKVTYKLNEWFSCYGKGLLDINHDLLNTDETIYTTGPGLGLSLRWTGVTIEASSSLAKSWGRVNTHQELYELNVNAQVSKMIALQIRAEHGLTKSPNSQLTDILFSCNISF